MTMVTPAVYPADRRYSRLCPPFSPYTERRYPLLSHDVRPTTMTEREPDESSQPRKRIAVACGRCRKRKIRCSGDPGNGGPCSNCKSAGHEPCLFLRVSSTETQLRDAAGDFGYSIDAARSYQTRGTVSPHQAVPQYSTDLSTGDMLAYRQTAYPYGSKGYFPVVSGWQGAYPDDGVDYGLGYTSYAQLTQDPVHMVSGYRYSHSSKAPVYVDQEASSYAYGSLVHRPAAAVNSTLPTFSLSSVAASLPSPPERIPTAPRTLPSSSPYRADGLSGPYSSSSKSSADVSYPPLGSSSNFDSPTSYDSPPGMPSSLASRSSMSDAATYHSSTTTSPGDSIYDSDNSSYRPVTEYAPANTTSTSMAQVGGVLGGVDATAGKRPSGTGTRSSVGGSGSSSATNHRQPAGSLRSSA
ncbi:hypothetical protein BX600DRAFT_252060 [Xylariales sp. PMI_506]|nr:hypothetical protein BX600DRAFT_252060 [Xylariales sp. PMI_506]